ncbi:hypothetical protein GGI23_003027, partial [Coemansia sp. RSA 2559]
MKTLLSIVTLGLLAMSTQVSAKVHTIALKKVDETPEATLQRYANTGGYIAQKYFGASTIDQLDALQDQV